MDAELERLLFGLNYAVFFRAYRTRYAHAAPAKWYVTEALGPVAEVGGAHPVTAAELLEEVEHGLRYPGDPGSGPNPAALRSPRFAALVSAVLSEIERACARADLIARFWLLDGHPAYPVFWDFAFVIAGPGGGLVLIGSSSD